MMRIDGTFVARSLVVGGLVLSAALGVCIALGQGPPSPQDAITGTVCDAETGDPIRGARVKYETTHIGDPWPTAWATWTDDRGKYRIGVIPRQHYTLEVSATGHQASSVTKLPGSWQDFQLTRERFRSPG